MGLDIWFDEDVVRILNAIEEAVGCFPPGQFKMGWLRCLAAVRAGFGLSSIIIDEQRRLTDGQNAEEAIWEK